jgi:PKHD-type hydroxylase
MMLAIPKLLDADALRRVRTMIEQADWVDGNVTSGHQSALAKQNRQLPETDVAAREAGGIILEALGKSPLFIAGALPRKVFPPLFNRYENEDSFGIHIDNAVRIQKDSGLQVRTDLSATLFLSDPAEYDGGELTVEGQFGAQSVKLDGGDMLLYPASSLHRVAPVTRGCRLASFFWIQSMVRDDGARRILFDLDSAIQAVAADRGQADPAIIQLTGVYHNLMRRWADV